MENKTTQLLQAEIMRTRTTVESVLEDINLLNTDIIAIQDDINELSGAVATQGEQITEATEKADTAQNTANSALSTANGALSTADSALTVANEANDTAGAAQTTANAAQEVAASKYTKPVDGIPEADLSEDVQTKLNSGGGGGAELSDELPLMNGAASAGTAEKASRADHVHPADTTKLDKAFKFDGVAAGNYSGVNFVSTLIYSHKLSITANNSDLPDFRLYLITDYVNDISLSNINEFWGLIKNNVNHLFAMYVEFVDEDEYGGSLRFTPNVSVICFAQVNEIEAFEISTYSNNKIVSLDEVTNITDIKTRISNGTTDFTLGG